MLLSVLDFCELLNESFSFDVLVFFFLKTSEKNIFQECSWANCICHLYSTRALCENNGWSSWASHCLYFPSLFYKRFLSFKEIGLGIGTFTTYFFEYVFYVVCVYWGTIIYWDSSWIGGSKSCVLWTYPPTIPYLHSTCVIHRYTGKSHKVLLQVLYRYSSIAIIWGFFVSGRVCQIRNMKSWYK